MTDSKGFVLYKDYFEQIQELTIPDRGRLLTAIYQYACTGEKPSLKGEVKIFFAFVAQHLDRDGAKYEARCQASRENGKKGGRPKAAPVVGTEITDLVLPKPIKADIDNKNENDNPKANS